MVYGVVGHKCHAKMLLVVRKETIPAEGRRKSKTVLKRYAHLGTGNYHPRTARLYSDFGLMTANQDICEDMHHVFMQLTGTGGRVPLKYLWQSPFTMHEELIAHIRAEARAARAGRKARIMAKMNALLEPTIIAELYKASQAGVKVDLVIRGVCALQRTRWHKVSAMLIRHVCEHENVTGWAGIGVPVRSHTGPFQPCASRSFR